MGLLCRVTTEPIQIARMTEPAHFISSDKLLNEKRRLLSRRMIFGLRHQESGVSPISINDRVKIGRFSSKRRSDSSTEHTYSTDSRERLSQETSSLYQTERGAFEMRVHRGDLTFVPPLIMTIITQYPEIHFEYTGGFLYVPPSAAPKGQTMDLMG